MFLLLNHFHPLNDETFWLQGLLEAKQTQSLSEPKAPHKFLLHQKGKIFH